MAGSQGGPYLAMAIALGIVSSLRMQAASVTFLRLPGTRSRSQQA